MENAFLRILNISILSVSLIIAVLLLRALIRNGTKSVRCFMWGVVGLRLIFPYSVEDILLAVSKSMKSYTTNSTESSASAIIDVSQKNNINLAQLTSGVVTYSAVDQSSKQFVISGRTAFICAIIWGCGCIFLLAYAMIGYIMIKKKVRASILLYDNIRICDDIDTPFLLGFLNPQIYLPSDIEETQMSYVIRHELVHLKRHDYLWKAVAYIILLIHWFNPFVWVAYFLFCKDIELSCDEKVVQRFRQTERKAYANALLACSSPRQRIFIRPLAFGTNGIKERIICIMKKEKSKTMRLICNILTCTLFLLCFFITANAESEYIVSDDNNEDYVISNDSSYNDSIEYETEEYLGVYSDVTTSSQDKVNSEANIATVETEISLGDNDDLKGKTVIILGSEISESVEIETETESEGNDLTASESDEGVTDDDDMWDGFGFDELSPEEECSCENSFYLTEGTELSYIVLYTGAGLDIDVILTAVDMDAWWSVKFTGGKGEGTFRIPADGYYLLSVRCSESNLQYTDSALDSLEITGTIVYKLYECLY